MLHKDLLEILACPVCHGVVVERDNTVQCDACQLAYPVTDDIPVMLHEEARPVSDSAAQETAASGE